MHGRRPHLKVIVTDLGGVVVSYNRRRVAELLHARHLPHLSVDHIDFVVNTSEWAVELLRRLEIGELPSTNFCNVTRMALRASMDEASFWACHNEMFDRNEPVIRLWRRVHVEHPNAGLYALSDTDPHRLEYIVGFTRLPFDGAVASFMVHCRKPDPRMFDQVLRSSGCEPGQCLFVDDIDGNVEAARACGLNAHRYDPGDPERDARLEQAVFSFLAAS